MKALALMIVVCLFIGGCSGKRDTRLIVSGKILDLQVGVDKGWVKIEGNQTIYFHTGEGTYQVEGWDSARVYFTIQEYIGEGNAWRLDSIKQLKHCKSKNKKSPDTKIKKPK